MVGVVYQNPTNGIGDLRAMVGVAYQNPTNGIGDLRAMVGVVYQNPTSEGPLLLVQNIKASVFQRLPVGVIAMKVYSRALPCCTLVRKAN